MPGSVPRAKQRGPIKACPAPPRLAGEMLSVLSDIMTVQHVDTVLQNIASTVAELFTIKRLIISVLDETEGVFRIRATHGFDPEIEAKIRKLTYSQERMQKDISDDFRIAENIYFIRPGPEGFVKGEEPFYSNVRDIHKPRSDPSLWHELDYLKLIFRDRAGKFIGYIEICEPTSGRVFDGSTIESMQIFSQLAAVAVENASVYQKQVEIARRSRFLGDIISHDINNYNQAVTSYLQMAMEARGVSEKLKGYLERASASAWSISDLVQRSNRILEIEQEGAENMGPLELGEVLKASVDEILRKYPEKDVKVDLKLGNKRHFITGNDLVDEVFFNILENAVEYDPHDKIVVDVDIGEFSVESRRYWCVSISDNGIGIPDSKKKVVFGRFIEGTESVHNGGLGLAMVRAVVQAHNGLVWVEDRVPGQHSKGSVFRVALPVSSER